LVALEMLDVAIDPMAVKVTVMSRYAYLSLIPVFSAVLVAAASAPDLSQPAKATAGSISDKDYLWQLAVNNVRGTVVMRFEIDVKGDIHRCKIARKSGIPDLDVYSCSLAVTRFKFRPANNELGKKIWDVKTQAIHWSFGQKLYKQDYFDYSINVQKLPNDTLAVFVHVFALTNESGETKLCRVAEPSGFPAIDKAACSVLRSAGTLVPVLDEKGVPTEAMQTIWLRFIREKPL
jgi:hypothetical protein